MIACSKRKKVTGILIEMVHSEKLGVVIGVALNVNTNEEHLKK